MQSSPRPNHPTTSQKPPSGIIHISTYIHIDIYTYTHTHAKPGGHTFGSRGKMPFPPVPGSSLPLWNRRREVTSLCPRVHRSAWVRRRRTARRSSSRCSCPTPRRWRPTTPSSPSPTVSLRCAKHRTSNDCELLTFFKFQFLTYFLRIFLKILSCFFPRT